MRILGMKLGDERCLNTGLPDPFELMRHSIGATNNHSQNSIRPCSNRAFRAYDDFFHHWQRYTSPFLCYTRNHIRRNWFTKILDWLSRHAHQTNFLLYYQRNHIPRISIAIYENISPEISSLYAWHLRRRTLQTLCVNVKKYKLNSRHTVVAEFFPFFFRRHFSWLALSLCAVQPPKPHPLQLSQGRSMKIIFLVSDFSRFNFSLQYPESTKPCTVRSHCALY